MVEKNDWNEWLSQQTPGTRAKVEAAFMKDADKYLGTCDVSVGTPCGGCGKPVDMGSFPSKIFGLPVVVRCACGFVSNVDGTAARGIKPVSN